jgi:hypothetical protein
MLRQSKHDRFLILRDRVLYYWRRVGASRRWMFASTGPSA